MFDPNSDIARQLAQALMHHQRNLARNKQAEHDLERLQEMLARAQALADDKARGEEP